MKALHLATRAIQCGEADVVIAGGRGEYEPRSACAYRQPHRRPAGQQPAD
ncbi:hypothetical protein [Klebsiella pneumoniae]